MKKILALVAAFASGSAMAATPIEPGAVIIDVSPQKIEALAFLVRMHGYGCNSVSVAKTMVSNNGYVLVCNRTQYEYEIKGKGRRWQVTVK